MNKSLLFLLLVLFSATTLAQRNMTTITINQVSAEEVAKVVSTMISPQSSVNHFQNKLIIKATPTEIEQIRSLLKTLDTSGRQLWITVKVDGGGAGNSYQRSIETSPQRGDNSTLNSTTTTTVTVDQRSYSGSGGGSHGVRATEGSPAYITTGQTVAMQQVINGRSHVIEASSGFYATARVNNNSVAIDIDQQRNNLQGGTISGQQLQSRVSGALGQWIAIGSVSQSQQSNNSGYGDRSGSQQAASGTIYIKVDVR